MVFSIKINKIADFWFLIKISENKLLNQRPLFFR